MPCTHPKELKHGHLELVEAHKRERRAELAKIPIPHAVIIPHLFWSDRPGKCCDVTLGQVHYCCYKR